MRTCMSESIVDFELPRCRSMVRPFPFWFPVVDPVIYITTVSGSSDSPRGPLFKDRSGKSMRWPVSCKGHDTRKRL